MVDQGDSSIFCSVFTSRSTNLYLYLFASSAFVQLSRQDYKTSATPTTLPKASTKAEIIDPLDPLAPFPDSLGAGAGELLLAPLPPPDVVDEVGIAFNPPFPYGHPMKEVSG